MQGNESQYEQWGMPQARGVLVFGENGGRLQSSKRCFPCFHHPVHTSTQIPALACSSDWVATAGGCRWAIADSRQQSMPQ